MLVLIEVLVELVEIDVLVETDVEVDEVLMEVEVD